MSGTYPTDPGISSVDWESEFATVSDRTMTLLNDSRHLGGHAWSFNIKHDKFTRLEFAPIAGFLMAQKGGAEAFDIVIPELSENPGSATSCATNGTSGSAATGATSVAVTMSGTLPAGAFFRPVGSQKTYMVTADRSGSGTLSFQPPLIEPLTAGQSLTIEDVPFRVKQQGNTQKFATPQHDVYNFSVSLVEDARA